MSAEDAGRRLLGEVEVETFEQVNYDDVVQTYQIKTI